MWYYLKVFGISLLLTEIIELLVMRILKEHSKKNVQLLILVNVLTNPAAVYLAILGGTYLPELGRFGVQIPIELLVIVIESMIYKSFAKDGWQMKRPVLLAVLANTLSWSIGLLL